MRQVFLSFFLILSSIGCQQNSVSELDSQKSEDQDEDQGKVTISSGIDAAPNASPIPSPLITNPPIAKKLPFEVFSHEDTRVDQYYWMRDDSRTDNEILSHLASENAYAEALLGSTEPLQERLFQEINNRIKKDDASVPIQYKSYLYYRRFEGDLEYPIYARKKGDVAAAEEILLNGNEMAKGHEYFAIGDYAVSTNEKILAYSVDTESRRIYSIRFKNLDTGEILEDTLEDSTGQIVWANDNQTVFYIRKDPQTLLGYQVYRHRLGTSQSVDVLVYEEDDSSFYTWLEKTKGDSYVKIVHNSTISQAVSFIPADVPKDKFRLFSPLEDNLEYDFAVHDRGFYILTNWGAKNYRIMRASNENAYNKSQWQEVIAHNENVLLQDIEVFNNYLVVKEKEKGQSRIRVLNLMDKRSHVIEFEDPVYTASIDTSLTMDTDVVRIRYSSLTTPASVYDYHMAKRELVLLKRDEVVGEFDPELYKSERIFVKARDGEDIPVSLVYRRDQFTKNGKTPLYLYGYGSYGYNIEPYFGASRLSLLDRGFVFAIAHIRGSQTLGRRWYDEGKMLNKKNTFHDFIDVTKALASEGYADDEKIFAAGGSAGGLLVGAVINMAPELYRGVAAHVPFVDVVTTMADATIPLTTNEYDEWGNPSDKEAYEYMLSYSPYDNVSRQRYPNILVTTGLHDSQVQYFEPAKWVAKLREYKTDSNRLVFKTNMEAGHGGASGRFRRNRERALEYAFFMDLIGITE